MNTKTMVSSILSTNAITQEELAKTLQVTPVSLSRWVTGKSAPRKEVLEKLTTLYQKSLEKATLKNDKVVVFVCEMLKSGSIDIFGKEIYTEEILSQLAHEILATKNLESWRFLIQKMFLALPVGSRIYDWNFGSFIQHFPPTEIIQIFKSIGQTPAFYNSIGLSWVFGEFRIKDIAVIEYLQSAILWASDSDVWWRAAFSLEKLGIDEAINILKRSLKQNSLKGVEYYLENLDDKRSVISILNLSGVENIETKIYPKLKQLFLETKNRNILINCCWLIGRFGLYENDIFDKLVALSNSDDYEIKYYTLSALQYNSSEKLRPFFESALENTDPLIRKIAARALRFTSHELSLYVVENALMKENNYSVISELTQTIYCLKNPNSKNIIQLFQKTLKNENGLIVDESDKWYRDTAIYNIFSQAEDPLNVCFDIIKKAMGDKQISNPIDIATGTGRSLWQIIDKLSYSGVLYGIDLSQQMCDFVENAVRRERKFTHNIKIIKSSIGEAPEKIKVKSSFIISSFGFPSHISDSSLCLSELKSIYELLSDDGIFITIGWDETFNDELNEMWYKHIPDTISARSFEEWRRMRALSVKSPRNCNLSWYKKGISVPLQFQTLDDSVMVMGYLFGRDAADYVIKNKKTEWLMSLGITMNTKEETKKIIKNYEKGN